MYKCNATIDIEMLLSNIKYLLLFIKSYNKTINYEKLQKILTIVSFLNSNLFQYLGSLFLFKSCRKQQS